MIEVAVNVIGPASILDGFYFKCWGKQERIVISKDQQRQNPFDRIAAKTGQIFNGHWITEIGNIELRFIDSLTQLC